MGSCERAASAADLLRRASEKHAQRGYHMRQVVNTPGGQYGSGAPHSHGFLPVSNPGASNTFVATGPVSNPGGGGGVLGGGAPPRSQDFGGRLQPSIVASGQAMLAQAGGAGSEAKDVPFEMLVLEVLLDATAGEGNRCQGRYSD